MKNLLRSGLITASLLAAATAQAALPRQPGELRRLDRIEVSELEEAVRHRVNTVGRRAYRADVEARWSQGDRNHRA